MHLSDMKIRPDQATSYLQLLIYSDHTGIASSGNVLVPAPASAPAPAPAPASLAKKHSNTAEVHPAGTGAGLARVLLPSKDAKAAAYEQEYRSAGNDTDEENLMMGYPVACCGVVAGIGAAGAGGRGGRGCGARGREVLGVGHGDLLIRGTAGVG
jgi:hypothetical protein